MNTTLTIFFLSTTFTSMVAAEDCYGQTTAALPVCPDGYSWTGNHVLRNMKQLLLVLIVLLAFAMASATDCVIPPDPDTPCEEGTFPYYYMGPDGGKYHICCPLQ
uniref:Secreted protein n=1 Tax=Steinernema glaseri TaxID=37863 RepID=A0A1I7XYY7_9BILA